MYRSLILFLIIYICAGSYVKIDRDETVPYEKIKSINHYSSGNTVIQLTDGSSVQTRKYSMEPVDNTPVDCTRESGYRLVLCQLENREISENSITSSDEKSILLQLYHFDKVFVDEELIYSVGYQNAKVVLLNNINSNTTYIPVQLTVYDNGVELSSIKILKNDIPYTYQIPDRIYFKKTKLRFVITSASDNWFFQGHPILEEEIDWEARPHNETLLDDVDEEVVVSVCKECGILCYDDLECITNQRIAEKILVLIAIVIGSTLFLFYSYNVMNNRRRSIRTKAYTSILLLYVLFLPCVLGNTGAIDCSSGTTSMTVKQASIVDGKVRYTIDSRVDLDTNWKCFTIIPDEKTEMDDNIDPSRSAGIIRMRIKKAEYRFRFNTEFETYTIKTNENNEFVVQRYVGCPKSGCCCDRNGGNFQTCRAQVQANEDCAFDPISN